ncbi:hypothetical protein PAXRUDRAFT_830462 [Paxillus rubicundulus Ve08.2h10]|uniref:Uncharacterized protein n=1 Tax=Paxillus rubicundulus Ve08.2h10 TaxID=930991 RepID=A0A0D0DTJ2_9AGAM|nr:hypothetical protein PAXRUDRAFT_830462 [Paxillus rubicundulus Ve08.2h10]
MPRRRQSTKAKSSSKPRPIDRKESKIRQWNKPADIELDEEDQFHASRDRILLDGGNEYDEDGDGEEEVFALQGMSDDEDEYVYVYEEAVGYDGKEGVEDTGEEEEEEEPQNKHSTSKHKAESKSKSKPTFKTSKDTVTSPQPDSEEETWGRSKGAYYSSNAAELDSDDEEANELEEQEALRLQAKARDDMGDDDFGLGGVVEGEVEPADATDDEEALEPILTEAPQDKQSSIRFLEEGSSGTFASVGYLDGAIPNPVKTKGRVAQDVSDSEDEDEDGLGDFGDEYDDSGLGNLLSLTKGKSSQFGQLGDGLEDAVAHSPPSSSMKFRAEGPPKKQRKVGSSNFAKTKTKTKITPLFDLVEPTYDATTWKKKSPTTVPADTLAAADPYGEATSLDHADLSDKRARKKSLRFHVSRIESSSSRRTNARVNAVGGDDDIPYRERRKAKEARLEREREKKIGKGLLGMGGDDLDDVDPVDVGKEGKKGKRKRELGNDGDDDGAADANGYYDLIQQACSHAFVPKLMQCIQTRHGPG